MWGLQGLDLFVQHSSHMLLFILGAEEFGGQVNVVLPKIESPSFVYMGKNKFLNLEVLHFSRGCLRNEAVLLVYLVLEAL